MKQMYRPMLLAAVVATTLGMSAGAFAQSSKSTTTPKVDKAKASYVVGWDLASTLPPIVREEVDPTIVANAVKAALSGKKPTMSKEEATKIRKDFLTQLRAKAKAEFDKVAAENKKEGETFLAKNKSAPGVHTTASGLQYKILKKGTGPRPGPSDTVQVEYVGSFLNGNKFDASADHPSPKGGQSMPIPLSNVIPGFREGLQLMQVGGHYKFWIPSSLAYGSQPKNGFPPNATIVFDVTLDGTKATPASDASDNGSGN
ncbi:MAG TPA: FKBP-type peptidyl-prolyl cis-trans isomerase [Oleiagrimonas sp.]|nr:FKBP-type peptidyl-prolyl cis-trans isomerase [Oleiagrimonas sp.]